MIMGTGAFWNFIVHWRRDNTPSIKGIKERGKLKGPENLALKSASAKTLLVNPTFNRAYAELLQQLQDGAAETKIEEKHVRESLYLQIRALVLLVTKLNHYAQEYELVMKQEQENKENAS
jgi:hypothetical protein